MPHDTIVPLTLVLGGARSGKSAYAESLLAGPGAVYIATAEAFDDEMRERIARHRDRRGEGWTTVEAPLDLEGALRAHAHRADGSGAGVLVDCLTVWLGNLMHAGRDVDREARSLLESLAVPAVPVVLVASEVGLGVVPENAMARAFRDHAGRLNQALAARADRVVLVTAGIPLVLKPA
ncbi:MAG: bifunctional adenosylcobinamide kinase/adenosylcobinamide-phosphate guanylyltransferase [Immundisolibacterales bacterium]|nr:bifunctional adenosylcobinamide kinase/adenosylcobinamide-phosphate guanylyltransferase [Immundisolibacterales bacterium]